MLKVFTFLALFVYHIIQRLKFIWLVVWNIFPYIANFIIPTDFHIFQRGWYTTNQLSWPADDALLTAYETCFFFKNDGLGAAQDKKI